MQSHQIYFVSYDTQTDLVSGGLIHKRLQKQNFRGPRVDAKSTPLIPRTNISWSFKIGLKVGAFNMFKKYVQKSSKKFYGHNLTKQSFFKFKTDLVIIGSTITFNYR